MENKNELLNQIVGNDTLWVEVDSQNRILNWGSSHMFEADGYIPIEMPKDEFFFKTLGDFIEYGHKYYKVVNGKAVLNIEEYKEVPEGYGIVSYHEDGALYFDTRRFMAKHEEVVHEVIYAPLQHYYVHDGQLLFNEEEYVIEQEIERMDKMRDYRNFVLLPAFDKWERAMMVGRTNTSPIVYEWYYAILDLDVEAINTIPEPIRYYLQGCQTMTF